MPKVNPKILSWARESACLTIEDAAEKLKIEAARGVSAVERLSALENGTVEPTRPMLIKMAKQYRRPLLTFYMSTSPCIVERGQDFRILPADHAQADEALVDALIRDVRARQSMVRAALEDADEAAALPFIGSKSMRDGVSSILLSLSDTLDISLREFRAQPSPEDAFGLLRTKAEKAGVYVLLIGNLGSHHTNIDLETFRGFALADAIAPFVVINDHDSRAAWSFTLVHELVHLWLGHTGVSGENAELAIERFCNDAAGEFLLPTNELKDIPIDTSANMAAIEGIVSEFARARNVSGSMVAYKLFRVGIINHDLWENLAASFRSRWLAEIHRRRERSREQEKGPNFYVVRRHRIGQALLTLADRMMGEGIITASKAGKVLGVKAKQVQQLFESGEFAMVRRPV